MSVSVFIIVPAYNEGRVLRSTLRELLKSPYSVVVVDDGSTDDTWSVLQEFPVCAVRHPLNLGQGAAIQTGMTFALQRGADIVVHFDADGQHRVEDLEVLIEPLLSAEADVVLGSRFLREKDRQMVPFPRRLLLRGAVIVNRLITGMRLSDAHNGLRAFTAGACGKISLRENGFAHASEILVQIRKSGLRCVERPTSIRYTGYSLEKGQSAWNALTIVADLLLRRLFR